MGLFRSTTASQPAKVFRDEHPSVVVMMGRDGAHFVSCHRISSVLYRISAPPFAARGQRSIDACSPGCFRRWTVHAYTGPRYLHGRVISFVFCTHHPLGIVSEGSQRLQSSPPLNRIQRPVAPSGSARHHGAAVKPSSVVQDAPTKSIYAVLLFLLLPSARTSSSSSYLCSRSVATSASTNAVNFFRCSSWLALFSERRDAT